QINYIQEIPLLDGAFHKCRPVSHRALNHQVIIVCPLDGAQLDVAKLYYERLSREVARANDYIPLIAQCRDDSYAAAIRRQRDIFQRRQASIGLERGGMRARG